MMSVAEKKLSNLVTFFRFEVVYISVMGKIKYALFEGDKWQNVKKSWSSMQ